MEGERLRGRSIACTEPSCEIGRYKMPGQDKTGPSGQGPMTGRGRGLCRDSGETIGQGSYYGRGLGRRSGRGRGLGRYNPTYEDLEPEEERDILEKQRDAIEKRLKDLE